MKVERNRGGYEQVKATLDPFAQKKGPENGYSSYNKEDTEEEKCGEHVTYNE